MEKRVRLFAPDTMIITSVSLDNRVSDVVEYLVGRNYLPQSYISDCTTFSCDGCVANWNDRIADLGIEDNEDESMIFCKSQQ